MISVCMATYNGQAYIKKQLDSILVQLSDNDEVIISDDGSTDATIEIISSYKDSRIKLLNHKKNTEFLKMKRSKNFYLVASNFENALSHAKGDYIFLTDQDDIWRKDKVSKMLENLNQSDIVMSNFSIIDKNDVVINERFYDKSPISNSIVVNIIKSHFLGCCMAFKKNVLTYALPFPEKLVGHDYWIGCLGAKKFFFKFIDEPLHLYRRSDINVSTSTGKSENPILLRIFYRIIFLWQVINRLISK